MVPGHIRNSGWDYEMYSRGPVRVIEMVRRQLAAPDDSSETPVTASTTSRSRL